MRLTRINFLKSIPKVVHSVPVKPQADKVLPIPSTPSSPRIKNAAPRPLVPNHFRPPRGQKQIFLPSFTLALIRPSPYLPPNYASFMVPLWFTKLDIKDYLYNVYNLHVVSVRSYVIQSKIQRVKTLNGLQTLRVHRPMSKKKMTVELARDGEVGQGDFAFPEIPEDLTPWGGRRPELDDRVKGIIKLWRKLGEGGERYPNRAVQRRQLESIIRLAKNNQELHRAKADVAIAKLGLAAEKEQIERIIQE